MLIDEKSFATEKLAAEVEEARAAARRGQVYTPQQVAKNLGLRIKHRARHV